MVVNYLTSLLMINMGLLGVLLSYSIINAGIMNFSFILDSWSLNFFGLLSLISSMVFIWSYYYMDGESNYGRFLSIVISFVGSMVVLIFMSSFFGAMIGWDGLGVTSFLLVIYYKNRKSLGSGMITALTNRLGDCFFLVILGVSAYSSMHPSFYYLLLIMILLTSMTKSAQIPFSSWLPSAMAAPTPVSALVHSSTLVTAGVYFLMRFNIMSFEWMLSIGSATMLMAGVCACAEMDIKKIVALSTLSQLGVMMISLSLMQKDFCFFHLMTHAMFKALLFMCVGVGIHTIFGSQDFRSFSGVSSILVWPSSLLLISNMSLLGFPFMSGFYSKDLILESFYSSSQSAIMGMLFLVGVGLTTAYSIKMMNLAFYLKTSSLPNSLASGGFSTSVKLPLLTLGLCSIMSGAMLSYWNINFLMTTVLILDKMMPLLFILAGVVLGLLVSNLKIPFLSSMWNLSALFQKSSGFSITMSSPLYYDNGWVEISGGKGSVNLFILMKMVLYPSMGLSVVMVWMTML
uniref:NADH-ubiquinone oxidoreductase chain 5 n=1 Tax=Zonosagitta nagae TaxID=648573 RepID=D3DKL7_9BILA|nr:NADH dehydrogenase subunit 5 [Zonosagitta nagae]BAI68166.1 NADH dehydrogenase subunit 5 [Zonosagitta nagae]